MRKVLEKNLVPTEFEWLLGALEQIKQDGTSRKLYLKYSLCNTKIQAMPINDFSGVSDALMAYLKIQNANTLELSRIWMLHAILNFDTAFKEAVQKLIQIADKSELETFLKYLILLPNPGDYQFAAVEALRTNIASVFDAISKNNPYPAQYFTEQQWNQMYLKAAFMQQDLSAIVAIDKRANAELARIISDYAHERWAASRTIDPLFWRPVSNFLEGELVEDVKRLFESNDPKENNVAALVCHHSELPIGNQLLSAKKELNALINSGELTWQTV